MNMTPVLIQTKHIPPSVNACYSNVKGKGRQKTQRYRKWRNAAQYDFGAAQAVHGAFKCTITIDRTKRRKNADIDNRIKPTLDLLQSCGVIEDDNLCEAVTCQWGEADGGMMVRVLPYGSNLLEAGEAAQ